MSNFFNLLSVLTIMSLSIGKLSTVTSSLKTKEFKKSYSTFVGVLLPINNPLNKILLYHYNCLLINLLIAHVNTH